MHFLTVWIPLNTEGHGGVHLVTTVLGSCEMWEWIAGGNKPFTDILNCLLTLI